MKKKKKGGGAGAVYNDTVQSHVRLTGRGLTV